MLRAPNICTGLSLSMQPFKCKSLLLLFIIGLTFCFSPNGLAVHARSYDQMNVQGDLPALLKAPGGERLVMRVRVSQGSLLYRCSVRGGWILQSPSATLSGSQGKTVFLYSGPRWRYTDGSIVQGRTIRSVSHWPNIPWLLIKVTRHSGPRGVFSQVNYVQRFDTVGGALKLHCDRRYDKGLKSVPYLATYQFWRPK